MEAELDENRSATPGADFGLARVGMRVPGAAGETTGPSEAEVADGLSDTQEQERVRELIAQTLEEEQAAHPKPETPEQAEHQALEDVFADIRHESHYGRLVTREHWESEGFVPAHMDADSFADLVFRTLAGDVEQKDAEQGRGPGEAEAVAGVAGNARADGAPMVEPRADDAEKLQAAAGSESEEGKAPAGPSGSDFEEASGTEADAGDGADAGESTGNAGDVPGDMHPAASEAVVLAPLAFDDIVVMEGKKAKYLYSDREMTDVYAKWSFLAAEDDKVATFVSTVREESEVYPRPMRAKSLTNDPFDMTPQEVSDTWNVVRESGEYPDIETCTASNGDVYYYSTEFLEDAQAEALAEYYSVRRFMSP